jgi:predicted NBD/HSP70 family sugar kinase
MTNETRIMVIAIETDGVRQRMCTFNTGFPSRLTLTTSHMSSWDPTRYINEKSGRRLFEEVARQCLLAIKSRGSTPTWITISLPGSIQGSSVVSRSSRLGVMESFDLAALFQQSRLPKPNLLRDVDCLAVGEHITMSGNVLEPKPLRPDFTYIFVDEGVGSAVFIDGQSYRGAGHAGPIGGLIVEPDGSYCPPFRLFGPLEVYLSRPSLSEAIVNAYLAEADKDGENEGHVQSFRNSVAAAKSNPRDLAYSVIRDGLDGGDPIAVNVVDRAGRYLGLAINSVITILNPPSIILAGGVVSELPQIYEAAIRYARRFSWDQAWNSTEFRQGRQGRDHQVIGAAYMTYLALGK